MNDEIRFDIDENSSLSKGLLEYVQRPRYDFETLFEIMETEGYEYYSLISENFNTNLEIRAIDFGTSIENIGSCNYLDSGYDRETGKELCMVFLDSRTLSLPNILIDYIIYHELGHYENKDRYRPRSFNSILKECKADRFSYESLIANISYTIEDFELLYNYIHMCEHGTDISISTMPDDDENYDLVMAQKRRYEISKKYLMKLINERFYI